MSKKKVLGLILITIIAIAGAVGYIGFSFTESNAYIDDAEITNTITQEGTIDPTFNGVVKLEQVVFIYNSGELDLEDITVDIQVFFSGEIDSAEVEVGQGTNDLGTVAAGENVSKTLVIELTNRIPRLAVEDGTFRIVIDVTLSVQYVPYSFDLPQQETTENWEAPFNPL